MAGIAELIRKEENGTISFGNYELQKKEKVDNFEYNGDLYKVKTFKDMTKLEKNGMIAYESVPGTTVYNYHVTENEVTFEVEGNEDAQLTLELAEDTEYEVSIDGARTGDIKTNITAKLVVGVELEHAEVVSIRIKKK